VRVEVLDVATALLGRFGDLLDRIHYALLEFTLRLLLDPAQGACFACAVGSDG
jgi:hypothetical protein